MRAHLLASALLITPVAPLMAVSIDCPNPVAQTAGGNLPSTMLPPGYLHTAGNQILDAASEPVRIVATGMLEIPDDTEMQKIVLAGFNAFRAQYTDRTLQSDLAYIDQIVATAQKYGMKVIINHHSNEGDGFCNSQQQNGLWYDAGPGTNNTDGCGAAGTVTNAQFLANWQTVARHYAGNDTVIGFDIHNEPLEYPGGATVGGGAVWGGGGLHDIHAMYQTVGEALEQADPGALIICEGMIAFSGQNGVTGDFDLVQAGNQPVTLSSPGHVVYSVHAYPSTIGGQATLSAADMVTSMTHNWGYLVVQNLAPIWVGEIGASLDGTQDSAGASLAMEQAWATTMIRYLNGQAGAQGGPTFTATQQGISTDWWTWGNMTDGQPDGTEDAGLNLRQGQLDVYTQFRQAALCGTYTAPAPLAVSSSTAQANIAQAQKTLLSGQVTTVPTDAVSQDSVAAQTPDTSPAPDPSALVSAAQTQATTATADAALNQANTTINQAKAIVAQIPKVNP